MSKHAQTFWNRAPAVLEWLKQEEKKTTLGTFGNYDKVS